MNKFTNQAAQGDLLLRRVASIPASAQPAQPEDGNYIVAHSETGHHHVIDAAPNVTVYTTEDPLLAYLRVIESTEQVETLLRHLRQHHTHGPIVIGPGKYELRRQREYTPEGWRRVAD
jgi:hypothetical protein